ncbi:MAG: hypothetical protein KA343_08065 [Nitrosomonas sp.]|jgi:hypothetical protein|nr:hypothetical protein [Nitrosomonas sp.]
MKSLDLLISNNNSHPRKLIPALVLVGILFLSIVSGVLAAYSNVILVVALLALYSIFFILAAPVSWIIWIIFWGAFVITGPSAYFVRFGQLQWLTVLMSVALLLPVLLHFLHRKTNIRSIPISNELFLPAFFLLLVIFSTIIDRPQFADFVNASRHYLFMWPLMLVFMLGLVRQEMLEQLWKALMPIAVLQLPMALYQYFIVASKSSRLSPWDAVVGTFPGNVAEGSGDSAGMAMMLLIAIMVAIALWRGNKLHGAWVVLVLLTALATLALAEVKAPIMLLPVMIALYYRRELIQRPIESFVIVIATFMIVGGLFLAYEKLHYSNKPTLIYNNSSQPSSTYEHVLRALSPDNESIELGQLGRTTHLIKWWEVNVKNGDLQHSLFGYGMGATAESKIGTGEVAAKFPYQMNISSSAVLLWETGILGHLVFVLILLSGAWTSGKIAKNECIPEIYRIFLRVGEVGLLLLIMTLPYKSIHFYSNPIQFLMMLMLGQAAYWSRFVKRSSEN